MHRPRRRGARPPLLALLAALLLAARGATAQDVGSIVRAVREGKRSWEAKVIEGVVGNGLGLLSWQVAQCSAQVLRIIRRYSTLNIGKLKNPCDSLYCDIPFIVESGSNLLYPQGYSMGEKLALPIFVFIDVVKTVIFSYFLYSDDGSVRAYLTVQVSLRDSIPEVLNWRKVQNHLGVRYTSSRHSSCPEPTDTAVQGLNDALLVCQLFHISMIIFLAIILRSGITGSKVRKRKVVKEGLMIPLLYDTWKYNFIGFCVEIMAFIDKVGNYQNAEKVFK
ncbi:hypothetical protein MG293_001805 [Ovis ammon polii]|uniref:Uncharacterized protein n=1 Tax=Ovis ammon polii TaxID=230172 RepID=A0AAD4YFX4_OVIAM|nr:hypothetical protein MG293_001805 [Ovis ammon polii]